MEKIDQLIQVALDREEADWLDQCRRQIARPLKDRIRFGFVGSYEKANSLFFATMQEYRETMARERPSWEGYGKAA